jgi:hypothetical protein
VTAYDAPEFDGVRERYESMRDVPPMPAIWNGQNWSEKPDRSEYEGDR